MSYEAYHKCIYFLNFLILTVFNFKQCCKNFQSMSLCVILSYVVTKTVPLALILVFCTYFDFEVVWIFINILFILWQFYICKQSIMIMSIPTSPPKNLFNFMSCHFSFFNNTLSRISVACLCMVGRTMHWGNLPVTTLQKDSSSTFPISQMTPAPHVNT